MTLRLICSVCNAQYKLTVRMLFQEPRKCLECNNWLEPYYSGEKEGEK